MTKQLERPAETTSLSVGVAGLDEILNGGLTPHRLYLIEGLPGSGKTTLALQFLLDGARRGEPVLYVTLSESEEEMYGVAASHGWSLEGISIHEQSLAKDALDESEQYTLFHPAEIELTQTLVAILAKVEEVQPTRVVIDSLSELRLLSGTALRYRRQILALKQYFSGRRSTVLVLDDVTAREHDLQVQSIAHGVIVLEQLSAGYGSERRRLRVAKYRGRSFRGGYHDYAIRRGGLQVFPRVVAAPGQPALIGAKVPSGIEGLDTLLGGGVERGTSTLIIGAAGTGKSTLVAHFAGTAAQRGERSVLYVFDENVATLTSRAAQLGVDLEPHIASGHIIVRQIEPAELSPGEFVHDIRTRVERDGVKLVAIDSLNGYLQALPEEKFLTMQLHELLAYLAQRGVATLLVAAHQGMIGPQMTAPVDMTYLADSVILMRYFEAHGEVRQAISVVKHRSGNHERTIRELKLEPGRIRIGEPLREFRGVLTGVPNYEGGRGPLMGTTLK